jgi:hypothetical protein
MSKKPAKKINTARFPGESDAAYKKRMARNARVRARRRKERALKRAAKAGKLERRAIPRRAADLPKPTPPQKHLAVLAIGDQVTLYVNGHEEYAYDFSATREETAGFIAAMDSLGRALGANVTIHDLRPSE